MTKTKIIESILKLTKKPGERYFDQLLEREPKYLDKQLQVIKLMKK